MRSVGNLLDAGVAKATLKRDPLERIRQSAAEVAKQAEQHDAAQVLTHCHCCFRAVWLATSRTVLASSPLSSP